MTLGELIGVLRKLPSDAVFPCGFGNPHSYRGWYEQLAFAPADGVTVAQMLECAEQANGATFQGYKGGEFFMDVDTRVWVAKWGESDPAICPSLLIIDWLMERQAAPRPEVSHGG